MRSTRTTALLAAALTALGCLAATTSAGADETTLGGDATRQNSIDDAGLSALRVGSGAGFGEAWRTTLDHTTAATPNQIYAQPLSVGGLGSAAPDGLVVVASEDNQVAGLDAATGAPAWQVGLGPGWVPTPTCGDLLPHIGVTSTPVYDASTRTVYLVAKADDGPDANHPSIKVHALDVLTGAERPGWPLTVAGRSTNGGMTFDPATSAQRPALLLSHGALYIGFASHCDYGPFVGFVGRVTLSNAPTLSLWATGTSNANAQGGVWQSGGGIMSDGVDAAGQPRLFFATGNGLGVPPAKSPGTTPPGDLADSVVRLAVGADGSMHAADFFSPTTNHTLDLDDADLGSGGPVALPDAFGSGGHPRLLVVVGKDGIVRLLDRDDLGGVGQGAGGGDAVVDTVRTRGVWGRAAAFDGGPGSRFVYLVPSNGYVYPSHGGLTAIRVAPDAAGNPTMSTTAVTPAAFGFGSGSPVVTSDDGDPTTALVWVVRTDGPAGTGAQLLAYPATPPAASDWTPLASFGLPTMPKFVQPATDGGRVIVGTRDGQVLAFAAPTPAVTATPTDFGDAAVGAAVVRRVTVTATRPVTVRSATASGDFSAPATSATLAAGATLSVPVTFTPSAAGLRAGRLVLGTSAGDVALSLRGTAQADGAVASPGALDLGQVAVGQTVGNAVQIVNTGADAVLFTKPAALSGGAALTLSGPAPRAGTTVPAHGAIAVRVRFSPKKAGKDSATLVLTGSSGGSVATLSVPVTATGYTGSPDLVIEPAALDFGTIAPGDSAAHSFQMQNVGDATMTITKAAPPSAPFSVPSPIAEGATVEPGIGNALYAQILAAPMTAMPRTDYYTVSVDRTAHGTARRYVRVSVNTRPWSGPVTGRSGCVTFRSAHAGTQAVLAGCTGSSQQTLTRTGGGYYHLGSGTAPGCLQVRGGSVTPGSAVELARCAASTRAHGQTWAPGAKGTLIDLHSQLCLRSRGGAASSGTPLVVDRCSSAISEQWDVTALLPNRGALSSGLGALGTYCLTDRGAGRRSGTPMELTGCALGGAGRASQVIAHLGNTLRVAGGCITAARGTAVLGYCAGTATQAWTPDRAGRLVNVATRSCLAVPGNTTRPGTALAVATCSAARGQRWTLPDAPTAR